MSVPAAHPYVAAVTADPAIRVLEDPPVAGAAAGVWWPPAALDPEWIDAHRDDADLLHLHFGTESLSTARLDACFDAAREAGWPVVVTVHDLEHPQLTLAQQPHYREQLEILLTRANALITLTDDAAAEIERRSGRRALVVPHPRLAATEPGIESSAQEEPVADRPRTVLLPLGDLRPNVAGAQTTALLARACATVAESGRAIAMRVTMRRSVRDQEQADAVRRIVEEAGVTVELHEGERSSDAELERGLAEVDVAVLPYRYGTHSGWLELCWDLGLGVLAPDVGCYASQHGDGSVRTFDPLDVDSLTDALFRAVDATTPAGSPERRRLVRDRRAQRLVTDADGRRAHVALYRELTAHE